MLCGRVYNEAGRVCLRACMCKREEGVGGGRDRRESVRVCICVLCVCVHRFKSRAEEWI